MRETADFAKSVNAADANKSTNSSFSKERSTMHYNFNYKNLNAKDLFCKIVATEKKSGETDLRALPLYQRCEFMLDCINFNHPEMEFSSIDQSILDDTRAELDRLDAEGDPVARYYLIRIYSIPHERGEDKVMMKAAAEKHYAPLAVKYLSHKLSRGLEESDCEMADSLIEYLYSLEPSDFVSRSLIVCHRVLHKFMAYDDSFLDIASAERDKRVEYANYRIIVPRILNCKMRLKSSSDDIERAEIESELAFWYTVDYMLAEYYHKRFGGVWNRRLAPMVFSGRGCEPDVARAVELDTAFMVYERQRFPEDRVHRLLDIAGEEEVAFPIKATFLRAFANSDFDTVRQCIEIMHSSGSRDTFSNARHCLFDAKFIDA